MSTLAARERLQTAVDKLQELARLRDDVRSATRSVLDEVVQQLRATQQEMDRAEDQVEYEVGILEHVPRAVTVTDLEFNIESWNKAAEAMYGFTEDEVPGERMGDVTRIEYRFDDPEEVLIAFSDTGHWEGEVSRMRKDGKSINVLSRVGSIRDQWGESRWALARPLECAASSAFAARQRGHAHPLSHRAANRENRIWTLTR